MKEKLVAYLFCPTCQGALQCSSDQVDPVLPWPEIMEGALTCRECGRRYPIRGGVPRLAPEHLAGDVQMTTEGFGWQWQKFNDQIQGTYMTDQSLFLDFIYPVTAEFFKDKVVLDAGCGMGRFLRLGARFGSREIIGVDLSNAVDTAYQNTRLLPNAHVVQADIMGLPFAQQFDYIFSVGVLHHMPDPQAGFTSLTQHLKPQGTISAWVYSAENNGWVILLLTPLRKYVTSRLPRPLLYLMSHLLGAPLYACLQGVYKPINESRRWPKLKRLLPYNGYLYSSSRLSYASLVSIVFDHLAPQLTAYVPKEEFLTWFQQAQLVDVQILPRNEMSWRGHGVRVG